MEIRVKSHQDFFCILKHEKNYIREIKILGKKSQNF